jgi:GT2 family glycosyltransferase
MPSVSVIVPVRNEEQQLGATLTALLANRFDDFDVVVVDDASTDTTADIARSFTASRRVRLIHNRARRGPTAATNRGARATDAALLFFVDGDCTPAPDWIAEGVRSFADPAVCAVEGAIHYAHPSPGFRHRVPINPFYNLSRRGSLTQPGTDYANGNFAVRREAFVAIGGFNAQRYAYGREDTDLGLRLRARGRIAFNPAMIVTHKEEYWTFRDLLRNARRYGADVRIFKDHGDFPFRLGRVLHPRLLGELCLPPLIPLRYPLRSGADLRFLPQFYVYLLALRLAIWHAALRERVLVV